MYAAVGTSDLTRSPELRAIGTSHTRRHSMVSKRPPILRDKNKMRVAELLREEQSLCSFEIASEARLQRHLVGQTSPQDPVSRRARRSRVASDASSLHGMSRDARIKGLFGTSGYPGTHIVDEDEDEDDLVDLFPPTQMQIPMAFPTSSATAASRSRSASMSDSVQDMIEDPVLEPEHVKEMPPEPASWFDPMPPPSPQTMPSIPPSVPLRVGVKRKCDDDAGATRRRPAPLPPWVLINTSGAGARSPRRPVWSAAAGGTVSPSSSPLASGATHMPRRVPTPVLQASSPICPIPARDEFGTPPPLAIPMPRSSSPTLSAWKPLARSPGSGGSGPGYGSGAIGLKLGSRTAGNTAFMCEHTEGHEMDEGVRMMGLS